ncbi:MAG: hypothetical protein ACK41Z_14025 [Sediminibacterium sp.]
MKTNLEKPVNISVQVLVTLTTFFSAYLTPEANAMYSGLKKLVEKTYAPTDSSLPIIINSIQSS